MSSTPEHVYAWLKNRAEVPGYGSECGDDELEEALLRRNSPLIDLGLARYGFAANVIRRMFAAGLHASTTELPVVGSSERGSSNISKSFRLAALSNRTFVKRRALLARFPHVLFDQSMLSPELDSLREFLDSADADEKSALFQNPTIDRDLLSSLFARERPFDRFDDEKWQQFIISSIGNPCLMNDYMGPMDGWAEYRHSRVFNQAWKLAETVEPSKKWAKILTALLEKTKPEAFSIKDPMSVIARWQVKTTSDKQTEEEAESYGEDFSAEHGHLDDFGIVRLVLTRLMSGEALKALRTSDDVALRCAFYRFGRPVPTEMRDSYSRDPRFFLNNALWNEAVWQAWETREILREQCWQEKEYLDLHYPNFYRERRAKVATEHPEWFRDQNTTPEYAGIRLDPVTARINFTVLTKGKGLYPFTRAVQDWLRRQPPLDGILTAFIQHTSCSLVIQENADPDVTLDLADFFERLVPEHGEHFRHTLEGPDDMTSHIRSALTHTSLTIPVIAGRMALGTWQGLYVFEHRAIPHQRHIVLQMIGVPAQK